LAKELGKRNILVNTVEPGLVASDRVLGNLGMDIAEAHTTGYPIPRPGTPQDVARAVLFFASGEADYITGASLLVDGGSSMSPMPDLDKILAQTNSGQG
jgi:3-oxoacyl-[acyl-carrier protein] reductase